MTPSGETAVVTGAWSDVGEPTAPARLFGHRLDADSPSPVFRTGCLHKLGAEKSNTSFYLRLPQAVKDHRPFEPDASQIL